LVCISQSWLHLLQAGGAPRALTLNCQCRRLPRLHCVLGLWAGLSLLSNAAAADTALRSSFFFLSLFFLPRPQPFFPTLHKGQIYLKSLGIIPLPLVQRAVLLCTDSSYSDYHCRPRFHCVFYLLSRQSLTLPLAASVLLLQLRLLPSILLLHPLTLSSFTNYYL